MRSPLSRRSFFRGGAAAAAFRLLPTGNNSAFAQEPGTRPLAGSSIQLGIASYTFRTFEPQRLIQALKILKITHLNVKDVHLPMTPLDQVGPRAEAFRAAGITLTAAGTINFKTDDDADVRSKFEYLKAAGISLVVASPTHQTIARVEKFAKSYDIRIAIHNHGPEDSDWPSPLDVLKIVRNMDPRMGCCVDVGHCTRAGVDVVDAIRQVGPRVFDVHMKDLAERNSKESQVAVGEGILPIRAIFGSLQSIGYKGCVDLEYEIFPDNPLPGVQESIAYMRGVIAGMQSKS